MTSRRSIACFRRFTSAAAVTAGVAAAAVCVRGERPARACSGGEVSIAEETTFDPGVLDQPGLDGVFYEPFVAGFGGYQPDTDDDRVLADWKGYLKDTGVGDADWKAALFTASAQDLEAIRQHLLGKSVAVPKGFETSSLWKAPAAAKARLDASLQIVQLARAIEPSAAFFGEEVQQPDRPLPTAKLLQAAQAGATKHADDPFLAQRYAFQAVRVLFYQHDFAGLIAYVDKQAGLLAAPSQSLAWRTRYYLAGALRQQKDLARATLELAHIHASYPPLAGAAASDFHIDNDLDWRHALDLAKTTRDKTEVWRLVGVKFDGIAAIREIVKLDPKSDLLGLLVVREVAKAESAAGMLWPGSPQDADTVAKIKKESADLEVLVTDLANKPGVDRKWLLDLVAGHLAARRGDLATARTRLQSALAGRPHDARVASQAKASLALALARSWAIDASHESELGRAMTSLDPKFDRAATAKDQVRTTLAPLYMKAGKLVDAEYLSPGIVDNYKVDFVAEAHPGKLVWAGTSFIKDMIARLDKTSTDFDHFVLDQQRFAKPKLQQELALRYLLDGDFATAQQTFATTAALSERLHTDPFVIHIRDCHDCDHDKYGNAPWTHASFAQKMGELAAKAQKGSGDDAAEAALQVGVGYYNMTWYGNARSILGDDTHQDMFDARVALKWFQRAFDTAKSRELKAKAAYFAAKAELGDLLDVAYDPNRQQEPAAPVPATWFGKLQGFKDTQYYKDVLKECGTFQLWTQSRH
jgi:hypothetical protein|nr:hypothetical protein [Kofleriaceae bacterium]